ncbi:MAG: hypothetical protein KF790_07350 [Steroidobacteraceae bacterium]|nr:hypothetical protein [Steroidobacteraceae bacterium]
MLIAFAAAFCLLFQQSALAAHHCSGPPDDTAMVLCASHCAPDSPVPTDFAKSTVPAVAHALCASFPIADTAIVEITPDHESPPSTADPPPRLRYCSLLI